MEYSENREFLDGLGRDITASVIKMVAELQKQVKELTERLDRIDNREQSTAADLYERLNKIERAQGYHRERIEKLEDEVLEVPHQADAEEPRRPTKREISDFVYKVNQLDCEDDVGWVMAHYIQSLIDRYEHEDNALTYEALIHQDLEYYKGTDND
jgi:predicted nuclease with TOPRIM domain